MIVYTLVKCGKSSNDNVGMLGVVGGVESMAQLHDVVYVILNWCPKILRFSATTRQRLTDIHIPLLRDPHDIAACE